MAALLLFSGIAAGAQQFSDSGIASSWEAVSAPVSSESSDAVRSAAPAISPEPVPASLAADMAPEPAMAAMGGKSREAKPRPESDITVQGMYSYGNWQIFAAGIDEHLYTAGIEYDRHIWGKFIGARLDYAADFMPLTILREPAVLNPYGVRRSPKGDNVTVPGLTFSPIGLRMLWRPNQKFKPYFTVMGGAIGFTKKALSPDASYYDFTLHENIGFYLKMTERLDLKFGLYGDFHFSNAYATAYNPGLDVMNSTLGLTYHFKQ